jgi:hypothetical protein
VPSVSTGDAKACRGRTPGQHGFCQPCSGTRSHWAEHGVQRNEVTLLLGSAFFDTAVAAAGLDDEVDYE